MPTFHVTDDWRAIKTKALFAGFYLLRSNWDDYTFKTTFTLFYTRGNHEYPLEIGNVKVGYFGQSEGSKTFDRIPRKFDKLPDDYFSLAESPEFYENLYELFKSDAEEILRSLRSIVIDGEFFDVAKDQRVFIDSLMRDVNINTITGQFSRIISGNNKREKFEFEFVRRGHEFSELNLAFDVDPWSLPPSNIQAIIGRNGLGKTTLLNEMVSSLVAKDKPQNAGFYDATGSKIESGYFSTVVSVSFSAFDPFTPLSEQSDQKKGTCYYYIGLKQQVLDSDKNNSFIIVDKAITEDDSDIDEKEDFQQEASDTIVSLNELRKKYAQSVERCFSDNAKKELWLDAIGKLESDTNFKDLDIRSLAHLKEDEILEACIDRMSNMSSGHAVVFMTISRLVEVLQEKTLVLFDEPESHLHPPLLSAFIRALSSLLSKRNGVAIMATHSPVVLQEIPRSSCWVLTRFGDETTYARPTIETFAENVGVITKEVFRLEMERSGFHDLFQEKVNKNHSFDDIIDMFEGRIGQEGRAILMGMILIRDKKSNTHGGKNA